MFGATVFPHNIGLGAANDPEMIGRIGEATATEVAATGLDWTFAPIVAIPRDFHWGNRAVCYVSCHLGGGAGRCYEGYSEDPEIVQRYAGQMVRGLQVSW